MSKLIAANKRAGFDYFIEEKLTAGIVLVGTEVKSLRLGKVTLTEAFVTINNGEAWVHQLLIGHYSHGNRNNHEENRKRKLLLHKDQIESFDHVARTKGLAIIPLRIFFEKSYVKLEIGLAKVKKIHDKRETLKAKDAQRKMDTRDY
ncbi:MAG: SsrA-binding protein SmpB [Bacteriovoracaceae bacterium]|nr:SsrA-binding protein SmpB [Bacteriovoracaceae bacterium]